MRAADLARTLISALAMLMPLHVSAAENPRIATAVAEPVLSPFGNLAPWPKDRPLDAWLPDSWTAYKLRFVRSDGRVVDDANGGISHSEGQGYGLLLAALADDRWTFARIWNWTARELLVRPDALAAWRWQPGANPHVTDTNNATDGDLLIAWALVEASQRWHDPAYAAAAQRIARAIGTVLVRPGANGPILLPAATGFDRNDQPDGPVVNLSYWVFPAFEALETVAPEVDWNGLRRTGLELVDTARFGPDKLPSDWISLAGAQPAPAKKFKPEFGYNAIRIPLYLAWARFRAREHFGTLGGLWNETADLGPFVIDTPSGTPVGSFGGRGFKLIAALARCIQDGRKVPSLLLGDTRDAYFPSTLSLLARIVLSTRYKQCV